VKLAKNNPKLPGLKKILTIRILPTNDGRILKENVLY
jgi:hypothetical protein